MGLSKVRIIFLNDQAFNENAGGFCKSFLIGAKQ
jgi:hypothetical protein